MPSPLPLLGVPYSRQNLAAVQERVLPLASHGLKGLILTRARRVEGGDDETIAFRPDLDLVPESGLFEERLGDEDRLRIADPYEACLHNSS
jgi:hypothetical protein